MFDRVLNILLLPPGKIAMEFIFDNISLNELDDTSSRPEIF